MIIIIQNPPVFQCVAWKPDMATNLQAFYTEHYLWCSDWPKLLGWLAAREPTIRLLYIQLSHCRLCNMHHSAGLTLSPIKERMSVQSPLPDWYKRLLWHMSCGPDSNSSTWKYQKYRTEWLSLIYFTKGIAVPPTTLSTSMKQHSWKEINVWWPGYNL